VGLQLMMESGCGGVTPWWLVLLELVLALALAAGILTPVAALLCCGFTRPACCTPTGRTATLMIAAMTAIALVLLGAGAYSVDARLFGRRRLVVPPDPMDSN
jgi:uncharacterized membrane protein YphA (DoxX/SURF4 family)